MIKTGLLLGLVLPLAFKPRATVAGHERCEPPPLPGLPAVAAPPVATVAEVSATDDIPWPELPQLLAPEMAVRAFLDEMTEHMGGDWIRFSWLVWAYEDMRRGRARHFDETGGCVGYEAQPWPQIKDKTLSTLLCGMGCEREQRDHRAIGDGRPTFIRIPAGADVEDDTADESIEPLRLAA